MIIEVPYCLKRRSAWNSVTLRRPFPLNTVNPYETFRDALTSACHLHSSAWPVLAPFSLSFQRNDHTAYQVTTTSLDAKALPLFLTIVSVISTRPLVYARCGWSICILGSLCDVCRVYPARSKASAMILEPSSGRNVANLITLDLLNDDP